MKFSSELENSINSRDITGIRAALIAYLDAGCTDNAVQVCDEVAEKLQQYNLKLFDVDDARFTLTSVIDPKADLRKIKAALRLNFSREKISMGVKLKKEIETQGKIQGVVNSPKGPCQSTEEHFSATNICNTCEPSCNIKESFSLPEDLENAVDKGEVSTVKSILMGYLDVFDKTETMPVIQYAAICKEKLEAKSIDLFVSDDGRFDFENAPLTAESLRSIKAKLRLNFSLEKMIFAEKIFQIEMQKKAEDDSMAKSQETISVENAVSEDSKPETTIKSSVRDDISVPIESCDKEQNQPETVTSVNTTSVHEDEKNVPHTVDTKQDTAPHEDNAIYTDSHTGSYRHQRRHQEQTEKTVKIEVIYKPGPLEHLFGQIGKFFDCLFNKKGKRIERPYKRK